jgi:hypothetical protein
MTFTFLPLQKSNKKRDPAKITAIAGQALIKLWFYCKLKLSSLIIENSIIRYRMIKVSTLGINSYI